MPGTRPVRARFAPGTRPFPVLSSRRGAYFEAGGRSRLDAVHFRRYVPALLGAGERSRLDAAHTIRLGRLPAYHFRTAYREIAKLRGLSTPILLPLPTIHTSLLSHA